MNIQELSITAKKAGLSNYWYGCVNGHEATAPIPSKELAIEHAKESLSNGSFEAIMLSLKGCYTGWLSGKTTSEKHLSEARINIQKIDQLLSQLK